MASGIKAKAQKGSVGRTIIITLVLLGVALKVAVRIIEKREEEKYNKILRERSERMRPLWHQLEEITKQEKKGNEFPSNLEIHYKRLLFLYNEKEYGLALEELKLFRKHQMLDYKDVSDIGEKVRIAMIGELEEKVRKIPAAKVGDNLGIYKQLLQLDPENHRYKEKVAFYQTRIDEHKRVYQERITKFGEPPFRSATDGSVRRVKEYLTEIVGDPRSLKFEKWGKIYSHKEDGWLVWCEFRAANALEHDAKYKKWFVIRHGKVVAMKDFRAYRW